MAPHFMLEKTLRLRSYPLCDILCSPLSQQTIEFQPRWWWLRKRWRIYVPQKKRKEEGCGKLNGLMWKWHKIWFVNRWMRWMMAMMAPNGLERRGEIGITYSSMRLTHSSVLRASMRNNIYSPIRFHPSIKRCHDVSWLRKGHENAGNVSCHPFNPRDCERLSD